MRSWDIFLRVDEDFLDSTLREPPTAVSEAVLYLHGWGGDREVQSGLLDQLCLSGYCVLNFNQRGFGASTGGRSLARWPRDASRMVDYLADKGLRVWICGLSTGGAMSLATMILNDRVAGAIAMSPFASLEQLFKDKPELRNRLLDIFGPFSEEDRKVADILSRIKTLSPRPLLLICGDTDQVIPYTHSRLLREKAGDNANIITIRGADHIISTIPPKELSRMVTDWMRSVG